jgi:hypothetical protein
MCLCQVFIKNCDTGVVMKDKAEVGMYLFVLQKALKRHKLQAIAEESGLKRTALSEFRRSEYLGKEKLKKLRNWFIKNEYMRPEHTGLTYTSYLRRMKNAWMWLRKKLEISSEKAIHQANIDDRTILISWEKNEDVYLPPSVMFKVLYVLLEWANPLEYPSLSGNDRDKQMSIQKAMRRLASEKQTKIARESLAEEFIREYGHLRHHGLENESIDMRMMFLAKSKLEYVISDLNENRPPFIGPIITCEKICSNCSKWISAYGKWCMHCGANIEINRPQNSDFIAQPWNPSSENN